MKCRLMALGNLRRISGDDMTYDELLEFINKDINEGGFVAAIGEWFPNRSLYALRAVVELHTPYHVSGHHSDPFECCLECNHECDRRFPYPCPTIQAIEKELI